MHPWHGLMLRRAGGGAVLLVVLALFSPSPQAQTDAPARAGQEGRRLALVMGNDAYTGSGQLKNAVADATAMAAVLKELGFDVRAVMDADRRRMRAEINSFVGQVQSGDVALFFYSGHGVQIRDVNYMLPIDFDGNTMTDVENDGYSANRVHDGLLEAGSRVRIIILDACRNNPFSFGQRSPQRGLAVMSNFSAVGSIISFATAPGQTAADNPGGRNGLFTTHLLEQLRVPGLPARQVFINTRERVFEASNRTQQPWMHESIIGELVLKPGPRPEGTVASVPSAAPTTAPTPAPAPPAPRPEAPKEPNRPNRFMQFLEGFSTALSEAGKQAQANDARNAELRTAIETASRAEAHAIRTLDISAVPAIFAGEALRAIYTSVQEARDLRARGIVMNNVLEKQDFMAFTLVPGESRAEVRLSEVWSTTYHRADNGECVGRIPSHAVPQTVYLERGPSGWMITTIRFDNPGQNNNQPQACQ